MRFTRDGRGSIAIMFAVTAIPLIALAGLGTEVGVWYVVKSHAQNAADSSAMSGALALLSGSDVSGVNGRVATVAAANGFTDKASPFPGASQSVPLPSVTGDANTGKVTVTVSQTDPAFLALVVGLSTATISATATASIVAAQPVCMLGLSQSDAKGNSSPVVISNSVTITGTDCSIMSNGGIKLQGALKDLNVASVFAANGCQGTACSSGGTTTNWYEPKPNNPLARLDDRTQFPLPTLPGAAAISSSNSSNDAWCPNQTSGKYKNTCQPNPHVLSSGNYRDLTAASGGTMTLSGGTISSITLQAGGAITLNAAMYNIQTVNLQGGSLSLVSGGTYNVNTVNVSGGTFTLGPGTYNTINVTGGTLTLSSGTYNLNSVSVNGGTLLLPGGTEYIGSVSVVGGGTITLGSGTYYLGAVTLGQGGILSDTATVTVNPDGSRTINGGENIVIETSLNLNNALINLTAHTDSSSLLNGVLVYDPGDTGAVTFTGNSNSTYGGALYFPNANLTWGGNSQSTMSCTEVIAYTVQLQGNTSIDTSGCPNGPNGIIPRVRTVLLTN